MEEVFHGPHWILQECHRPPSKALLLNITDGILTTPLGHLQQRSDSTVVLLARGRELWLGKAKLSFMKKRYVVFTFVHFSKNKTFHYFFKNLKQKKPRLQNNRLQQSFDQDLNCLLWFQVPSASTTDVNFV